MTSSCVSCPFLRNCLELESGFEALKKCLGSRQQGKTQANNTDSQREKSNAARKNTSQQQKTDLQQKEYILDAAGKMIQQQEKRSEARKKTSEAGNILQQRKPSFAAEKSTQQKKTNPQREKTAAPKFHLGVPCPLSLMSEFNECCSVWIGADKYVIHSFQTEYVHRQVVLRDICVTEVSSNVQ